MTNSEFPNGAQNPYEAPQVPQQPYGQQSPYDQQAYGTAQFGSYPAQGVQPYLAVSPGVIGKNRNPFGVWVLTVITFGIYGLVWYYKINKELAEFDSRIQVSPGLAVLALFIPIVGWVSLYNTAQRISQAQQAVGRVPSANGWIGIILSWIGGFQGIYYQSELNGLWNSVRR